MKKFSVFLLLFLGFSIPLLAQSDKTRERRVSNSSATPQPTPPTANGNDSDEDGVLRVETSLVTIPVSVIDRNGRFVAGLQQTDFKIYENGKEQEVGYFGTTEQPITVILLIDVSPSTAFKIEQIHQAATAFVNQLKPTDRVMIAEFDNKLKILAEPTSDRAKLQKAIRKADFGDGTSLYDAIDNVLNKHLAKLEGRKAIVMFTDGVDTSSYKSDGNRNLSDAEKSEAPIHIVSYNTFTDVQLKPGQEPEVGTTREEYERGSRFLEELAERTGGKVHRADTMVNLTNAFAGIAEELKLLYSVGFYPTETSKIGERKQLRVEINRPNLTVQARDSYIVGEKQAETTPTKPRKN